MPGLKTQDITAKENIYLGSRVNKKKKFWKYPKCCLQYAIRPKNAASCAQFAAMESPAEAKAAAPRRH